MSQFNLKKVILGIEDVKGTPPDASKFYNLNIKDEIGLHVESNTESSNLLGDGRLANEEYLTTKSVSGTVPIGANYSNIYFPLALAMGIPATVTDNGDGTYTRIFTPQDCIPTVSVQRHIAPLCSGDDDFYELFSGVAIDGWSINIEDEQLQVPMNAKAGKAIDSNDDGFTAIDDTQAIDLVDANIRKAHASLKKDGNTYKLSSQFAIQIGNNIQETWYIGDGEYPSGIDIGLFTMSGNITGVFDAAFLKQAKDNGRSDFEITFINPSNTKVKLVIALVNVFVKYKTDSFKIGEKVTLSFDWVADVHSTVSATLTNTVQTY